MCSSHGAGSMPRVCQWEQSSVSRRFSPTNSSRTDFLRRTTVLMEGFSRLAPSTPTARTGSPRRHTTLMAACSKPPRASRVNPPLKASIGTMNEVGSGRLQTRMEKKTGPAIAMTSKAARPRSKLLAPKSSNVTAKVWPSWVRCGTLPRVA